MKTKNKDDLTKLQAKIIDVFQKRTKKLGHTSLLKVSEEVGCNSTYVRDVLLKASRLGFVRYTKRGKHGSKFSL